MPATFDRLGGFSGGASLDEPPLPASSLTRNTRKYSHSSTASPSRFTTVVLHRARSFVRRDGRRPGRGRAGRRAAGAGYVPATAAQFNRRWRRFGKYGEMKRHELLRAAEAKRPLPVAELQRKSALSMREEAALLGFRRRRT